MASAFTHAFVAVSAGLVATREKQEWRFWAAAVILSILPDADVFGFALGIRYEALFGHRGFSHSIVFAILISAAALPLFDPRTWKLWLFFAIVTASHGVLDAMTDGGLGIAFFSPFSNHRYFFPWTPIRVSPIGIREFFTSDGLGVLASEFLYVWIPVSLFVAVFRVLRRRRASPGVS
jgi:inner membrane protein